jgi:serine protease AprX
MYRSIRTINADVAQAEFGARGQGIVWAVVGTGVESSHSHFKAYQNLKLPNALSHWEFSDARARSRQFMKEGKRDVPGRELGRSVRIPTDKVGHGTSIASIIAGESTPPKGEVLRGMAPECKLLSINVSSENKTAFDWELNIIAALRTLQEINAESTGEIRVHGVVIPLELPWDARNYACGYSPVCVEVDRLVNSGVVVVAAAGNKGFDAEGGHVLGATITDPGNAPNAITVGSTHRSVPHEYGPSFFSARGPTGDGRLKPDLLAPGERITCIARKAAGAGDGTLTYDGTAYAAAHVSGAIAALLSVQRELIGRPLEVKNLLMRTAVDLGREKVYQGAGLLDLVAALRDARKNIGPAREAKRPRALNVFCSYSHNDASLWLEFKTHLSPMERTGLIVVWSDQAISAGTEWEPQIYENLEKADIVLLFVSSFFVASDYCYSKEMGAALQRHRAGKARVIPILVRPVDVGGTPIADIQMLPPGARPVTGLDDPHQGWADIALKLREIVMELRGA